MKILDMMSEIPCRVSKCKPVLAYNGGAFNIAIFQGYRANIKVIPWEVVRFYSGLTP